MRDHTLFPNELHDLFIGLAALVLAILIWSIVFVPAAV